LMPAHALQLRRSPVGFRSQCGVFICRVFHQSCRLSGLFRARTSSVCLTAPEAATKYRDCKQIKLYFPNFVDLNMCDVCVQLMCRRG
jgi:hypothetical protein